VEIGPIVLIPNSKNTRQAKIVTDPVTGLPLLSAGKDAQVLSSREVDEILTNFP
jgi:hypothetical protein